MNWNCPHCNHDMVITYANRKIESFRLMTPNKDGGKILQSTFYICSNDECQKITLINDLFSGELIKEINGGYSINEESIKLEKTWNLIPDSKAKIFPDYIPKVILDDYKEACLIKELSPKASATLSRRCLQGIIRDFWGISKSRLIDEINELEEKVDGLIYKAIDATRKIGNIGAHMESDINIIVEVDSNEAEKLITLIEILLKECYITRYEREKSLSDIIGISEEKDALKKSPK